MKNLASKIIGEKMKVFKKKTFQQLGDIGTGS
jgi:hypothetical protein